MYDFDNDGWRDIFIFHGGLIHLIPQEHSLFRNLGGGKFQDVSEGAGPFFATKTVGRGACFADYDSDGKMDAFLVNLGAAGQLLHNTTPAAGHWLMVRLVGTKSNRDGIGAKVEVTAGGKTADRPARRRLRLSQPGRLAPAFRPGQQHAGRKDYGHLAQRHPADGGECRLPTRC